MAKFAAETTVSVDRSKAEIESVLRRYGATAFVYAWQDQRAAVMFEIDSRRYRVVLPLPAIADFEKTEVRRTRRSESAVLAAYEQAVRQRWRALVLWIKATLECNESGIVAIQTSLLPFMIMPSSGHTVAEILIPQIDEAYRTGNFPPLLPGGEK